MYYEVYLDLLFVFNLWMSWILMETACLIINRHTPHHKLFLMSLFYSGMYIVVVCLPIGTIAIKSSLFQLVGAVCFSWLGWRTHRHLWIQGMLGFHLAAFCIMGIMEWLNLAKNPWLVMAAGTVSCVLLVLAVRMYRLLFGGEEYICEVLLQCGSHQKRVRGLLDSGNSLCEPISCSVVHIISAETARALELYRQEKLRMIPYESIGKSHGMLEGYFADSMTVKSGNREKRILCPCLGIYEGELSKSGEYEIILNSRTFK